MGDVSGKLDFWEFTVPYHQADRLASVFPGGWTGRTKAGGEVRGFRGYTHSAELAIGAGLVGWCPDRHEMGIHCSLGGEALQLLAGQDDRWRDLPGMVGFVHDELGGKTRRLDLAFDDQVGILDVATVHQAVRERLYTARWHKWRYYESYERGVLGETCELGAPQSDTRLVIYDKRAERLQHGHDDQVDGIDHWVRVEVRLRRDWAFAAAEKVKAQGRGVWLYFREVLAGMVEFKERGLDDNRARWPVAKWWARFLGAVSKAYLEVPEKVKTLAEKQAVFEMQNGPSMAVFVEALGFDNAWGFLYDVANRGRARMGARHDLMVSSYRQQQAAGIVSG